MLPPSAAPRWNLGHDLSALHEHPVALWLENEVALGEDGDGRLRRRTPLALSQIAQKLAEASGEPADIWRVPPSRVAVFKDRVEVRNPGTLMEGISLKTLKTSKVSRRRNPLIADLLRRIHLIEVWGRGIPLILEKDPNVCFSQVSGIFITEFPRPVHADETESEVESRTESGVESG